ncbi:unnamed protein product, partial [marine sediment metagenome]
MSISSRIHDTIEDWIVEWRDRLRGWMASWLMRGITDFAEGLEPSMLDISQETLTKLKELPDLPPEYANMIE